MTSGTGDPGSGTPGPRIAHYLLGSGDFTLLAEAAAQLEAEHDVSVRVISGTPERPAVLAASMTPDRADRLRAEYSGRLVVESDQPLDPYGAGDPN